MKNITLKKIYEISKNNSSTKNTFVDFILILCFAIKRKAVGKYFDNTKKIYKEYKFTSFIELNNKFGKEISKENLIDMLEWVIDNNELMNDSACSSDFYCSSFYKFGSNYIKDVISICAENVFPLNSPDDYEEMISYITLDSKEEKEGDESNGVSSLIYNLAELQTNDDHMCIGPGNGVVACKNYKEGFKRIYEPAGSSCERTLIATTLFNNRKMYGEVGFVYGNSLVSDVITYNRPLALNERTFLIEEINFGKDANILKIFGSSQTFSGAVSDEIRLINSIVHSAEKKAIMVVSNNILYKDKVDYRIFRQSLLDSKNIKAVIQLPKNIFKYSKSEYSIICIDKTKKYNNIFLLDLSVDNDFIDKTKNCFKKEKIKDLIKAIKERDKKYTKNIDEIQDKIMLPSYFAQTRKKKVINNELDDEQVFDKLNEIRNEINDLYIKLKWGE